MDKQAEGVVVIDLRTLSNVTDFFVVCTAGSSRQLTAIKDHVETVLARHGCSLWHTEGVAATSPRSAGSSEEPNWLLMDCGDVVVHVLDPTGREFYRLEELWADAPRVTVPPEPAASPARRPS